MPAMSEAAAAASPAPAASTWSLQLQGFSRASLLRCWPWNPEVYVQRESQAAAPLQTQPFAANGWT